MTWFGVCDDVGICFLPTATNWWSGSVYLGSNNMVFPGEVVYLRVWRCKQKERRDEVDYFGHKFDDQAHTPSSNV